MLLHNEKVYIGLDLSFDYAQISYCMERNQSVETYSLVAGEEQYHIPNCIFKRKDINQWFVGKEAENFSRQEEGTLIDHLFTVAISEETLLINGEEFEPIALLTLFIKRVLAMPTLIYRMDQIAGITFSVPTLDGKVLNLLRKVAVLLNLKDVEIFFLGREECIYQYMIQQPLELWKEQVDIFDGNEKDIYRYKLMKNEHTTPVVVLSESHNCGSLEGSNDEKDESFLQILKNEKLPSFTAAYLIGNEFYGEWYKKSLEELCKNRRVFKGNNLYSKGACYYTMDKLLKEKDDKSAIIYLGKDKLKTNIGMRVKRGMENSYLAILDGGENWYECRREFQIILPGGNCLNFIITPLDGRNSQEIEIVLEGLEERPKNMTRLNVVVTMLNDTTLNVEIQDMGFGEFYHSSGMKFQQKINLIEGGI